MHTIDAPSLSVPAPALHLATLQLTYRMQEQAQLPRWKGALLRGGLGHALRAQICDYLCEGERHRESCPYEHLFVLATEQHAVPGGQDVTRPYVVIPPLDDRTDFQAGEQLTFQITLIGAATAYAPHVIAAYTALGRMGLGKQHSPAHLEAVQSVNLLRNTRAPLRDPAHLPVLDGAQLWQLGHALPPDLTLRFRTPMRIKHNGDYVRRPSCDVLIRAALRRISQLALTFGGGAWDAPFGPLLRLAEQVPARDTTHWVNWTRTSGTSGQRMNFDGFVGSMTLTNVPAPLRSILLAGALVHIGKATAFGNGGYEVQPA